MKLIYIAGPYRGASYWQQEQNVRRAEELALEVWRCGGVAICPHTNTRFYQGELPDDVWLKGDLAILARCDAILMTPDWEQSQGAKAERWFAERNGITVLYTAAEMAGWLEWGDVVSKQIDDDDT